VAVDASPGGLGLVAAGPRDAIPAPGAALALLAPEGIGWARVVHARRILPGLWRLGLALQAEPVPGTEPHAYLAA
jgi:cellulose synthase (UDP-forming)